jgi:hypothetical protein
MNIHRKSSTALAAFMAVLLAAPAAARADEGGEGDHDRGPGWHKGGNGDHDHGPGWHKGGDEGHPHGWDKGGYRGNVHYNTHYRNTYYGHYAGPGPYYPHYHPRYYPHAYPAAPCTNCGNSHHHNNHDSDNDKLWIGLLGGGILGYGLGTYMHNNAADQGNNPQATSAPPPPLQYANTTPANTCLQQREYNTKIMVGGKQVNGYGTACLQPDGSWRYGAAQPEY